MNLPKPRNIKYDDLINEIKKGEIRIPQFQREFVWEKWKTAQLVDSLLRGYPIGTFIFWKTKERLRSVGSIEKFVDRMPSKEEYVKYVLDGQQRITSLFVALQGAKIDKTDYSKIYINLIDEDEIMIYDDSELDNFESDQYIKFVDLISMDLAEMFLKYGNNIDIINKISYYKKQVENYDFSIIETADIEIDVATDIFTRINVGGKPLTVFEIMCAKTYDYSSGFDLREKSDNMKAKLTNVNFDTINEIAFLQLAATILSNGCQRKHILKLDKPKFIEIWGDVESAIMTAIDFFRTAYSVKVSKLLPFNALLVPFGYYFYNTKNTPPSGTQAKYLEDFFWKTSLSGRYSSAVEGKVINDTKNVIDKIIKGEVPKYEEYYNFNEEYIRNNGGFSTGKSFIKAILVLLSQLNPRSFKNNAEVIISNDWLKVSYSKNYHHFFPKAHLKRQGYDDWKINHIANITIVDDYLNKRIIKDRAPKDYIQEFKAENNNFEFAINSHMIGDLNDFGVWEDNYQKFFEARIKNMVKAIESKICL
ncbi:DUF262 domain-containing protein [Mycoplasmatota bacterium WC44]